MKYLLNSAVLPAGDYGLYRYSPATVKDLTAFLHSGGYVSRIGYPETAEYIYSLTGIRPSISRKISNLKPGDSAMVVRLRYRIDPAYKGASIDPRPEDWEIGLLVRES